MIELQLLKTSIRLLTFVKMVQFLFVLIYSRLSPICILNVRLVTKRLQLLLLDDIVLAPVHLVVTSSLGWHLLLLRWLVCVLVSSKFGYVRLRAVLTILLSQTLANFGSLILSGHISRSLLQISLIEVFLLITFVQSFTILLSNFSHAFTC